MALNPFQIFGLLSVDFHNGAHRNQQNPEQQLRDGQCQLVDVEVGSTQGGKKSERERGGLAQPIVSAVSRLVLGTGWHGFAMPVCAVLQKAVVTHANFAGTGDQI